MLWSTIAHNITDITPFGVEWLWKTYKGVSENTSYMGKYLLVDYIGCERTFYIQLILHYLFLQVRWLCIEGIVSEGCETCYYTIIYFILVVF